MIKGFKEFILRGNVIDLAVAVVIGAAFTTIVNAIVVGIFNPLIGVIFDASSLDSLTWQIRAATATEPASVIAYGAVISALIQFVIVAIVLYFAFVLPINHLKNVAFAKKAADAPAAEDKAPTELELLADIRDLLANGGTPTTSNSGKHVD
ncbi:MULTISPECIES: large conductance mechanosensitive channel protein MscL [unclassified Rathayibacter]|uniref:large conductance mechanosensitive channel protein MscL n=1 Tax=unclassified Rathayibacter TaxID=2609250 RepID=UPI00188C888A|nr:MULTISPECIES: large conductance mechanosensitive channel protein MscL [unclassified Rathayibacter]MBF4461789.1 large conductance mechanosensitive channel protein MscL [Rathayibacter sp. VKM Ac-2879]MBF4503202.1 large conductance mechanosensitive channel protein MscL [Rathayibacter sp. VKM Ac-2878]